MRGRRQPGFTLPEILIALAVSGVLLSFLFQIFLSHQRSHEIQEQLSDTQQSARVILDELTRSLSSLGAGADVEHGQLRLLVAHPHQLVFNGNFRSDHPAMVPGTPVPGATANDPCTLAPLGSYAASSGAETYRFTLDRTGDNIVDPSDRTQGEHYTLYREINGGDLQEIAPLIANPRVGESLFRYWGDFDGDGAMEALERVDRTTSPRLAAGERLDAIVRKIEINLVAETAYPDPRRFLTGGYRQVRLQTSVCPENLVP